jgi:hypothetical protein
MQLLTKWWPFVCAGNGSPSPGAAGEASVENKADLGWGEGELSFN